MKHFVLSVVVWVFGLSNVAGATHYSTNTLEPVIASKDHQVEYKTICYKKLDKSGVEGLGGWFKWGWQRVKKTVARWLGVEQEKNIYNTLFWSWITSLSLAGIFILLAYSASSSLLTVLAAVGLYIVGWVFGMLGLILLLIWLITSAE